MRKFETTRRVLHSAANMFDLVGDVEQYPAFVPLCSDLRIRRRRDLEDHIQLICDMTAAYKLFSETFTSQVTLKKDRSAILVKYLNGPFRSLDNVWRFEPLDENTCNVGFFIEYEFRSRALQLVAGAVFDRAFEKFSEAFEARADQIYGISQRSA